jgi:hypothetical protein
MPAISATIGARLKLTCMANSVLPGVSPGWLLK